MDRLPLLSSQLLLLSGVSFADNWRPPAASKRNYAAAAVSDITAYGDPSSYQIIYCTPSANTNYIPIQSAVTVAYMAAIEWLFEQRRKMNQ